MLSELDETIRELLVNEGGFDPTEIEVSFEIPNREWSSRISKPTLNCYLFDIHENLELRQHGVQTERAGTNGAARRRPRLFFDMAYLITAWTRAVEDEHRLLWHVLQTLVRFSSLPQRHLQGALRDLEVPVYTKVAQPNGVLKSPGEFWGALENQMKPSVAYVATLAFDRETFTAGPPVRSTTFRFRQPDTAPEELLLVAGTVMDDAGSPRGGAVISIEGRAISTITNQSGQFRLYVPAPGRYAVVAQDHGDIQRREVDLPAASLDFTLPAVPTETTASNGAGKGGETKP